MEAAPTGDKMLEKLALPQAVQPAKPAAEAAAPKVDDSKLASLAQPVAPAPQRHAPDAATPQPVDLSKADEKLSSLLGGKK
jgi:hypothetical protein